ncbi:MAG: hypothetical protein K9L30_13880 [Desulfobacterales bacterium]|nr:hypothetical protein [Desulfobacterales bacterium]
MWVYKRQRNHMSAMFVGMALALMVVCIYTGNVLAASSCVSCHTDENKLTKNLSKKKPQKSTLTSGAG